MNTNLLYLADTYMWQGQALVQAVGQDEIGCFIVLDATLFYPRGGGQEADSGKITSVVTGYETNVTAVRFATGQVLHYVKPFSDFEVGETVTMQVDQESRLMNAANHTVGHLIVGLITRQHSHLKPIKGYHFANGPYIELLLDTEQNVQLDVSELQVAVETAIAHNLPITAEEVTYDALQRTCSYIPAELPKDKPLRIVTIDGLEPLPCGGTHLRQLGEIGIVKIRKIKRGRGVIRVSYEVVRLK